MRKHHDHDCARCHLIGSFIGHAGKPVDVWVHERPVSSVSGDALILRFSSVPSDYASYTPRLAKELVRIDKHDSELEIPAALAMYQSWHAGQVSRRNVA